MRTLATIRDQDIDPDAPVIDPAGFRHRQAVRAVLFNEHEQVGLLHVTRFGYHKLPGGGMEPAESHTSALKREALEETGCDITMVSHVGKTIEYLNEFKLHQVSHCYLAHTVGSQRQPTFTESELAEGFEFLWVDTLDSAISVLEADRPSNYGGRRVQARDLLFLRTASTMQPR